MEHKIPLGSDGWSLWRWIFLRGAGFPAVGIEALRSPRLVDALELLGQSEEKCRQCREEAQSACLTAGAEADENLQQKLDSAIGRLHSDRLFKWRFEIPAIDEKLAAWKAADKARNKQRQVCLEMVAEEHRPVSQALRDAAEDPLFQEALLWQNREALHNTVEGFLRGKVESNNAKARERKRVIAKYLQRYYLKNDTIGFFGPVGWATFETGRDESEWQSGPLIDERKVRFEPWAIDILAAQLALNPDIGPYLRPRRKPTTWLEGSAVHAPQMNPVPLSENELALMSLADGSLRANELVARAETIEQEAGLEILAALKKKGVLIWGIDVPPQIERPELWLRELLLEIDDAALQRQALEPLDALIAARDTLAAAAGDVGALDVAIREFEALFESITGSESKRGHGKTYAGRQIFFEDCSRGGQLEVGKAVVDSLAGSLSHVLESARWFSFQLAKRYNKAFHKTYDKLVLEHGEDVPSAVFLGKVSAHFSPDQYSTSAIVKEVQLELQRRWASILGLGQSKTTAVNLSSAEIADPIKKAFDAPRAGWPRAKFHSPDLMIASSSLEAMNRGEYLAVLGETHTATNTLFSEVAYFMHPDKEALVGAYDQDIDTICVGLMQQKASRATHPSRSRKEFEVEFSSACSWMQRDHVYAAGDLVIRKIDGALMLVNRHSQDVVCDVMNFMDRFLTSDSAPHFNLVRKEPHQPRITIDKLVISRERWFFPRAEFADLCETGSPEEKFVALASWRMSRGLPTRVFATVPTEPKPFYVDFESTVLVDVFLRYLAKAPSLSVSEMLPDIGEQWLSDEDGKRYTSELRLVAVDPKGYE